MDIASGMQTIAPSEGLWRALHEVSRVDGPAALFCGDDCLARGVTFHLDDYGAELMLCDRFRSGHRGGMATVESAGRFPFGAGVGLKQVLRYASNHVRGVIDVDWPRGGTLRQRLGLGGMFLPGPWRRVRCLPPVSAGEADAEAGWVELGSGAAAAAPIGPWQRPPLAWVLERPDGSRLEVGTGSDLWRWERGLGFGPGAGDYVLTVEPAGVRVVRAPLVAAAAVQPEARAYRFGGYLAWQAGGVTAGRLEAREPVPVRFSAQGEALVREAARGQRPPDLRLDLKAWPCPAPGRRLPTAAAARSGVRGTDPCWESAVVQKAVRRMIRQIASLGPEGTLALRGMAPGACWDPSHWDRHGEPLPHWDMEGLLELSDWGRQQLGPDWQVMVEAPGWEDFPSVGGLFARSGFATPGLEVADA